MANIKPINASTITVTGSIDCNKIADTLIELAETIRKGKVEAGGLAIYPYTGFIRIESDIIIKLATLN